MCSRPFDLSVFPSMSPAARRLHSLAATLAALPSMSLVPVAPFSEPDLTIQRSNVLTISAAIRVHSCPFVVKRNQLDGELRSTDKRSVGKGIDPEERATYDSRVGLQNPPHAPWPKRLVQRVVRNRK